MARKYDRYGRNRQFRRNPTRNPKFFPYELPFLPDFSLKKNRDTTIGSLSSAKWRDVVREARGRTARRAEAARDKRAREELDLYTNSQHQIRNAMGEIMLGEAALYRASKRMFGEPVRLYMFDEFRL
jgi:predicted component of viral defense system (DUF524 family)